MYGISELSKDAKGYVYWKDAVVEHFSFHPSKSAEEEEACQDLAEKCRKLEAWGFPVSSFTACLAWSWFAGWDSLTADEQSLYFDFFLISVYRTFYQNDQRQIAFVIDSNNEEFLKIAVWNQSDKSFSFQTIKRDFTEVTSKTMEQHGFNTLELGQAEKLGYVFAETHQVINFLKDHHLGKDFFDAYKNLFPDEL